jgi:ankyrin repeat protein
MAAFVCRAVNVVIDKNTSIVNDKMAEGFTALHIAVANDFVEICSVLINRVSAISQLLSIY